MVKAVWENIILAESDNTIMVEGNHYFPPDDVKKDYLIESDYRTRCPWKGLAHYYNVMNKDKRIENAAWTYPEPKEKARHIRDHIAFMKDIKVE